MMGKGIERLSRLCVREKERERERGRENLWTHLPLVLIIALLSISSISLVVLFLSITIIYFYFLVWLISLSLALVHCSVMLGSEHFSNQPVPLSSLALATLYLLVSFYQAPNKGVFVVQGVDWILCLFDYLQEYCGLWSHECMQYWSVCGQNISWCQCFYAWWHIWQSSEK